jgi:16S rRNA (cytosine1402-N4)-methyltransferase
MPARLDGVAHVPVLFAEVMAALRPASGGAYLDGTLGAGGHAAGLLDAAAPDGRLLGLDRDPSAVAFAANRLAPFGQRATLVVSSFGDMADVAPAHGFDAVDGILLDLGLSSRQLGDAARGFSFAYDGPLDMRFDARSGPTAADLINNLSAEELTDIFFRYGEEQQSRRIARLIVAHRPMQTTAELATLIEREARRSGRPGRHPATKVFQALRIAVNGELDEIERGLRGAVALLRPGGQLPLAGRPAGETVLARRQPRMRLPAAAAGLYLWRAAGAALGGPQGDQGYARGDCRQPAQPQRQAPRGGEN